MTIPVERWYESIKKRHSVRSYKETPIGQNVVEKLQAICSDFSMDGVRVVLVSENVKDVFRGVIGPYGKVKGAPLYITVISDKSQPHVQEKSGYVGEGIILEATALGLGTCWVGGLFNPQAAAKHTALRPGEIIPAVISVGYQAEKISFDEKLLKSMAKSHTRKELSELVSGLAPEKWPQWAATAFEAARIAPSALNRQPWRFVAEERCVTVKTDDGKDSDSHSKRLDCGIAMLHLEIGARREGAEGRWEYLEAPEVAKYILP
ncbi:MAG: nitroreductase family protein [Vulcanimicrobiota bacterium]